MIHLVNRPTEKTRWIVAREEEKVIKFNILGRQGVGFPSGGRNDLEPDGDGDRVTS